jgi:hypothetical protein
MRTYINTRKTQTATVQVVRDFHSSWSSLIANLRNACGVPIGNTVVYIRDRMLEG